MSQNSGLEEAIYLASEKLKDVDFLIRCQDIGLPTPNKEEIRFKAFGMNLLFHIPSFQLSQIDSDDPLTLSDQLLVMHYLTQNKPLKETDEKISFKGYPEGQFYWQTYITRSVKPLVGFIGNDLELLKTNLQRFDWEPEKLGDFAAKIHLIGKLYMFLVYHLGDEEFPAEANVLFDACIKQVYLAEHVAILGSSICVGLL